MSRVSYIFAGKMPWHASFASVALADNGYFKKIRVGAHLIDVETLAHVYAWENRRNELNQAGGARVP